MRLKKEEILGKALIEYLSKNHCEKIEDMIDIYTFAGVVYATLDALDLEPIKNKIREGLKLHAFHGSDLINLNGDVKEDTKKMFEYVMNTTDIYDKAYVMQSVVDRVLDIYFNTLKKIDKEING
ncbi:hypothetical protein [Clostridium beijerinckii]|uniref:Uncharacterized protein n=1 Tax=Clostridium beijerinckii TaxID=1520 RepID=A0AAE5LSS2_CLOBE|nr:hypothetical protein [Clostridium beijerinckii]NSB17450.1 hypothetical protein [Clostridium beijerinckii]OOM28439.1 hypothetical protein CLOBE_26950 [Clostridium beijerinckii]